jgi:hypothetical protein
MQKAMKLNKKKNLDSLKGNPFSVLQSNILNQIAADIDIEIGIDENECNRIIDNLVENEIFVEENPEVLLPTDLDIKNTMKPDFIKESVGTHELLTPSSMKEHDSPILWTEVARKGKNKTKTKSMNNNIGENDNCIPEY